MNLSNRSTLVNSYNQLFKDVEGKGEKNLIETVAVRTMAKAVYSTDNIGHYLKPRAKIPIWNGPLECRFVLFNIFEGTLKDQKAREADGLA